MEYTVGSKWKRHPEERIPRLAYDSTSLVIGHMREEYVPQGRNEALRHSGALSGS